MYFSTTVLTSLGQAIAPTNELQTFFTLVIISFGIANMAFVISTTGVLLTTVDSNEEAFRSKRMR